MWRRRSVVYHIAYLVPIYLGHNSYRLLQPSTDPKRRTPPQSPLRGLTFVKHAPFLTGSSKGLRLTPSANGPKHIGTAPANSNNITPSSKKNTQVYAYWGEVSMRTRWPGGPPFAEQTKKMWLPTLPQIRFSVRGNKRNVCLVLLKRVVGRRRFSGMKQKQ